MREDDKLNMKHVEFEKLKFSVGCWIPKSSARRIHRTRDKDLRVISTGFPGGTVVKNPPANAGDTGSSPGPGRSHMPRSN